MLRSLHISHYILIDSLSIEFPEGLVIVTGQTGAGKSIILGALSLISGAKAEAAAISDGADSCVVEAEFDISGDDALDDLLKDADADSGGDSIVIRRVIARSGRSRSFVNDCPVNVSLLQSLSEHLIDIHSQHKSLLLTDHRFRLSILDRYAGDSALLASCQASWEKLGALRSELADLKEKAARLDADADYNKAQFRQLEAATLKEGELESLETEQRSLANAEEIKEALSSVLQLFSPEDEETGVIYSLSESVRQLERISKVFPAVDELAARIGSARIELDDIRSEIDTLNSGIDVSPEHLEQVEDRMSLLYTLLKKHNCSTIGELIAVRNRFAESLADSSSSEERISAIEASVDAEYKSYTALCSSLSSARKASAPGFAAAIIESLRFLELERAAFEVHISDADESGSGADKVDFLFSATGSSLLEVEKCASGGELSRIMLSLKAMMAKYAGMPTLIFDEIDTGVSGSVADKIGQMICGMGRDMQVFSITHLPQVAAKGDAHYVVSKEVMPSGKSVTSIHKVEGKTRVMEIARLLSGSVITDAAIANAEALLEGH